MRFDKVSMMWIFGIVLIVASMGIASAAEWDNVKGYDEETQTITVKNALGLPLIGSDIASVKLNTPLNNLVPRGYNKVAEFKIVGFTDYADAFKEMEFYNVKSNMDSINREFDYRMKVFYDVEVDDYKEECDADKLDVNGTSICITSKVGSHTETKVRWDKITPADIMENQEIIIGIFTDVQVGDKVEWIPNLFGVRINEWAVWTESLNADLIAYYKFDEEDTTGTGTIINEVGVNGANIGADNSTGKIVYAYDFESGNTDSINTTMTFGNELQRDEPISISVWVKAESLGLGVYGNTIVAAANPTADSVIYLRMGADGIDFNLANATGAGGSASATYSFSPSTATWYHIVATWDATANPDDMILYVDGTQRDNNTLIGNLYDRGGTFDIGIDENNARHFDGIIDEVGFWNRSLTPAEVTQLYNGETGMTYSAGPFLSPPTSTLNTPADASTITNPNVMFNATGTDNNTLQNMSLIVNGSYISTNSSPINNTLTQFPYTLTSVGLWNWTVEACDDEDSCVNATTRTLTYSNNLTITLNAPPVMENFSVSNFGLNGTASDDTAVVNVSLILNATYNGTTNSPANNTLINFDRTLADGFYNWTMEACDVVSCVNATAWNFTIDATLPLVNITLPYPNNTLISQHNLTDNQTINWTATDLNLDTCWINYNATNRTVTCNVNTSSFALSDERFVEFWANDTFGNYNSITTYWDYLVLENTQTANASSFETASEKFYANITTNGTAPTTASLWFDGASKGTATVTNIAGNVYNLSKTIDIPTGVGAKSWFYNFFVGGTGINTSTQSQLVNLTNFTHFLSGTPFLNISFKNETLSEELVDAVIDSDWYYWLGGGGVVKTLSFTNASENAYYAFLLVGVNRTINTNVSLTYSNSISQQRNYVNSDLELTNTTTELSLYLLPTTEGVYVTFQVISIAEQPISGVFSNVTRAGALISSGLTDDSGAIAYFLDPDRSYTFTFFKSGYDIYTTTLTPTQTTYTITLGQEAEVPTDDFTRGINYSFSPGITTLTNGTFTFFNFSLTSSYWDVNSFGFNLTNQDGATVNTTSATTNGGTVYVYHNTSNDTSLTMTYYWIVTGNITSGSFSWVVFDGSGSGFGLTTFFSRITIYLSEEIYGLNANSMVILIYLIIFVSVGIMSLKFGIRSPATIMMVLFGLSFLFEVHLGLIPLVGTAPILTTIMGIIVAISLVKEYQK